VETPPHPIPDKYAVIPRTIITALFLVGLLYFGFVVATFRSYAEPWPDDSLSTIPESSNGQIGSGPTDGDLERGRSTEIAREERERRISLRRWGSPDVFPRINNTATPPEKNGLATGGAGTGIATGGAGGFTPRNLSVAP